jgi:cell division protein FtsQ
MKRPQGFDTGSAERGLPRRTAPAGDRAARERTPASRTTAGSPPPVPHEAEPDAVTAPVPILASPESKAQHPTAWNRISRNRASRKPSSNPSPATDAPDERDAAQASARRGGDRSAARMLRAAIRERRRVERGEMRRFTQRSRRRRLAWLAGVGAVVFVLLVAVLVSFSPLMALRTIDVVGTSRIDGAAVRKSLDGQLGKPLPFVDYDAIATKLRDYPLIRSYSIETKPPGTLVVRIVERQPIGLLQSRDGFELVDQAGVVISRSAERPGGYPLIVPSGAAGSTEALKSFTASAAVLAALPQSVLPQVTSVTAKSSDDVTLTMSGGATVVWGSPEKSDLKAADLIALLKSAPGAETYDVSSPTSPVTR